jgi:hypothetical protein
MEMRVRQVCEAAITRLRIDLRWSADDGLQHVRAEVLVPIRRMSGEGWSGWPAYLACVGLLRAIDERSGGGLTVITHGPERLLVRPPINIGSRRRRTRPRVAKLALRRGDARRLAGYR